MSVQCNQYLCYGYKFDYETAAKFLKEKLGEDGYEDFFDEYSDRAFDSEIVEVNDCSMLWDFMEGEWIFFGKIYAKSDNYEPLSFSPIPITPKIEDEIITKHEFKRIFGTTFENVTPQMHLIALYR